VVTKLLRAELDVTGLVHTVHVTERGGDREHVPTLERAS
jgi:hypothetical protein